MRIDSSISNSTSIMSIHYSLFMAIVPLQMFVFSLVEDSLRGEGRNALPRSDNTSHNHNSMNEKIKIRYNYLFEYDKGPKRNLFKKWGDFWHHQR